MYKCLRSPKLCTELLKPRAIHALIGLVTLILLDTDIPTLTPVQHITLGTMTTIMAMAYGHEIIHQSNHDHVGLPLLIGFA